MLMTTEMQESRFHMHKIRASNFVQILNLLKEFPPSKQERIAPAKAAFGGIQGALPTISQPTRKRDRLRWVTGGKSKFEKEFSQNGWMETSATLSLLFITFSRHVISS